MKKSELIHWRLQAMLREHTFSDLAYLGVRKDSIGIPQHWYSICLLYTSPSPRDRQRSRMPSSA